MFVRWKKRQKQNNNGYSVSAYLVRAYRDAGKPKQKVLAHIGTWDSQDGVAVKSSQEHAGWWCNIEDAVQRLGLDEETSQGIFREIEKRAPRPSEKAIQDSRSYRASMKESLKRWEEQAKKEPPVLCSDVSPHASLAIRWAYRPPPKWQGFGRPKTGFTAFLEETVNGERKLITQLNTKRAVSDTTLSAKGGKEWYGSWGDFWFDVHRSLVLAKVSQETYREAIRLLGRWAVEPTREQYAQIISRNASYQSQEATKDIHSMRKRIDKRFAQMDELRTIKYSEYSL